MVYCAVAGCNNSQANKSSELMSLHHFPRDPKLSKQWLLKCKRQDTVNLKNDVICSAHFNQDDFEIDYRNELLGWKVKRRLKVGAVPSRELQTACSESSILTERQKRAEKRKHDEIINKLFRDSKVTKNNECEIPDIEPVQMEINDDPSGENAIEISLLKSELNLLKQQYEKKSQEFASDITELKKSLLDEQKKNRKLEKELKKNKCNRSSLKKLQDLRAKLGGIFSPKQLEILNGKTRVKWHIQDFAKALALKCISTKAYQTLRVVWKLPLPCVRTLVSWAQTFTCQNGVLSDVLQVLKAEGQYLDSFSKLCVISFDEMSISAEIVWDKSIDAIIGPHSHAQVAMITGIFSKWKQPIFYDFDKAMDKKLLNQLIFDIECAGYNVYAVVSDQGGSNQALGSELEVTPENCFIENPHDCSRRTWIFYDMHHIIKLFKNHIIDHGVVLEDGTVIDNSTILHLIQENGTEFCYSSGMTIEILELSGAERMKVGPVLKFFSAQTVALADIVYSGKPAIGRFFRTLNDYISIFSSRRPVDGTNSIQSGYGYVLNEQNAALDKFVALMTNMRVRKFYKDKTSGVRRLAPRLSMLPFQKGALISISSLRGIYGDVQPIGGKYILTSRLLQDPIESLFSIIRSFGGTHDHPNPCEFKYRLRLVLLGSKLRPPKMANIKITPDAGSISYVSSRLLEGIVQNVPQNETTELKSKKLQVKSLNEESLPTPYTETCENRPLPNSAVGYLAGYIAYVLQKRTKKIYGEATRKMPLKQTLPTSRADFAWIYALSRGGLLKPNEMTLDTVKRCEIIFCREVPSLKSVVNTTGISKRIFESIKSAFPNAESEIVKLYIKTRLSMRVKFWNKERRIAKLKKKKLKNSRNQNATIKPAPKTRNAKKTHHFVKSSK